MAPRNQSTADWMANLPQSLQQLPLSKIAIPGSHDTGAYNLDVNGPVASDAPSFVKYVSWLPGVKRIAANWGNTQNLDLKQQLEAGIRYFDLRVAVNPQDKNLYLVHTLYGPKVEDLLSTVDTFLNEHTGEIILLDFNHFYDMTDDNHKALLGRLLSVFGSKLCSVDYPVASMNLEQMIVQGKQVIVFYQCSCSAPEKRQVATRASILSPWPNTTDPAQCVDYLTDTFAKPPVADYLVCQGVLTPAVSTVVYNLCGSLRKLNSTLSPLLMPWLRDTRDHLNIVLTDFVGEAGFIETVLKRNLKGYNMEDARSGQRLLW
ncbi:PI-PLC X domain-containing protein 2 [Elysia marginata]|uniref:PI-PLC X domain-containing protein 2 n=1 Tax=Elysia marginata TaxID=1093978 RepID=A0AAV4F4S9_9GAST|nr:PI-PLC X domain-containing protein 2 [Elysia marginata]